MGKIPFKVSARAARLIGRENVSNAESAVVELVKNSYDADANYCLLFLCNEYQGIPLTMSYEEYNYLNSFTDLSIYYTQNDEEYILNEGKENDINLVEFLSTFNVLYILDDGNGMSKEVIENQWMTIGTNNKEKNYISQKGRIQTGAKGIGRFALDRLGSGCTMYTKEKVENQGYIWSVEWDEFEKSNVVLNEVYADLNPVNEKDFEKYIKENILDKIDFSEYEEEQIEGLKHINFNKGTVFEIRGLRDNWDKKSVNKLYNSLDSLIPPREEKIFDIYLFTLKGEKYGAVKATICNEFDYKLVATVDNDLNVKITIYRDELDKARIDKDLFQMKEFQKYPYDKDTFEKGYFTEEYPLSYFLPKCAEEELHSLKNFTFTMYYMKRDFGEDDFKKFNYKHFNPTLRRDWLNRYGGVKIFRDNFRVRPYGEANSTAFDWLSLGARVQRSPAGVGKRSGAWRVRANQISGTISISRENNVFEDKSSREGLQETKSFDDFKTLIVQLINEFEKDRQKIMRGIRALYEEKSERTIIKEQGKNLAEQTIKTQEQRNSDIKDKPSGGSPETQKIIEQLEKDKLLLAQSYKIIEETIEEKENELKLLRALAGTGIALTSLAHEIKTLSAPLVTKNQHLKRLLNQTGIEMNKLNEINLFIDAMSEKDRVLKGWLDVALNIVSKDKRKRNKINVFDVISKILKAWDPPLKDKNILYEIVKDDHITIEWRAHIIDIESIINNLVINSIIALQQKTHLGDRKIKITLKALIEKNCFEMIFEDNGPGLSKEIRDKNDIFMPLFSTRSEDGTGLGLWIVKTIVEEYRGEVVIEDNESGFGMKFKFPLRKGEGITIEV